MDKNTPGYKLIIFAFIIIIGMIIGSFGSLIPAVIQGVEIQDIIDNPNSLMELLSPGSLRFSLLLNHLFLFILPSIIFGIIFYKSKFFKGFLLGESPKIINIILGIGFLFVAYPLVNFAFYVNSQLPLADWMISTEQNVAETLNKILGNGGTFSLVINILLIAVMPAIGEELVFRGILQKYFSKFFKNPHIGIWLAAAIFSGIHFQFEGFLARMVLGAILGYAFYFTKNLWIPIIIHFLNNLLPIIAYMVMDIDMTDTTSMTEDINWLGLAVSIVVVPGIIYLFIKYNGKDREIRT